jgi:hypothetical protein
MTEPGKSTSSAQAPRPERLAFTLDATSGEIIKIENVDSAGHRRELAQNRGAIRGLETLSPVHAET